MVVQLEKKGMMGAPSGMLDEFPVTLAELVTFTVEFACCADAASAALYTASDTCQGGATTGLGWNARR